MALEYLDRMIADGFGRAVTAGAFSTGFVGGGAGTVLDLDQPELVIGIPAQVVARLLLCEVVINGGLATTDSDETEALIAVDSLGVWSGDGTSTAESPSNMNSKYDKGSMCRVGSAFTADMTTNPRGGGAAADPVLDMELARLVESADLQGTAANMIYRVLRLVYEPSYPVWLEGPASICVYFGGTRATIDGFILARWVESSPDTMRAYMKGEK